MIYPYPPLPRAEVEALAIKTSYFEAGQPDKPLVLLLHGMSSSADTYRETMHNLAEDFWLIAPDIPGFGYSDSTEPFTLPHLVEWLASFREALELPSMMLLAHSFGGALATEYTSSYPQQVSRLLLVAPAVLAGDLYPDFLKRLGLSLGLLDLGSALTQNPLFYELQAKQAFYDPGMIEESVWTRRQEDYERARASTDVLKALAFQETVVHLPSIEQPTLIVWGEEDPVLPSSQAARIAEAMPDAAFQVWKECGHVPFIEQPARFVTVASAFLGGDERQLRASGSLMRQPVVSVFGGSTPQQGSQAYEEAYQIGRYLAEQGFSVATGGYGGVMSAVSQGAAESGGHVIAVTSDQIETFRPIAPNAWIAEEIRYETLQDRLIHLVRQNDAMIVLPGGIGTLSEMALAWSYLQVSVMPARPLVLMGESWRRAMAAFVDPDYVRTVHFNLLHFAASPREAVDYVAEHARPVQTPASDSQ